MQTSGMNSKGQNISTTSQPPAANFLKASQKLGSIKGQMNYTSDQTCFSRWDDPMHAGTVTQKVVS